MSNAQNARRDDVETQPEVIDTDHPVVLFDGVCNFCNGVVRWVFDRDPSGDFRFAPLQSDYASGRLGRLGRSASLDTIVLIEQGRVYERSDAVLRIARRLRRPWSLAGVLLWIPRPVRDLVYRCVAKVRYRVWGRRETCGIPPAGLRERFLDLG